VIYLVALFVTGIALFVLVNNRTNKKKAFEDVVRGVFTAAVLAAPIALAEHWTEVRSTKESEAEKQRSTEEATAQKRRDLQFLVAQQDQLVGAAFAEEDLDGFDLAGEDLRGANLARAHLNGANLQATRLDDADLRGAELKNAVLSRAVLKGAQLSGADLTGARLDAADFTDACLAAGSRRRQERMKFVKEELGPAKLNRALLAGADMLNADLYGVEADEAIFEEDLRAARNLGPEVRAQLTGTPATWPTENVTDPVVRPRAPAAPGKLKGGPLAKQTEEANVREILDGDTVSLEVSVIPRGLPSSRARERQPPYILKARLAGIQAPGLDEKGGVEALKGLRRLVREGQRVSFKHLGREEPLGRIFVLISARPGDDRFRGDASVNQELVRQGYARSTMQAYRVPRRLATKFHEAALSAKHRALGVWKRCPNRYPFDLGG